MATKKLNEHAEYIQKTNAGGLDAYTKGQQDRYNEALAKDNVDLIKRLNADASRVGYSLTGNSAPQPQMQTQMYTPERPDMMSGQNMAKLLGLDYNEQNILNKFNTATKDQYAMLGKEFDMTQNKFYDQLYGTQSTMLDTIRKSQAQAIATGASRGLQSASELSSMLGLQQETVAGATQLGQERNLLKDKEAAAYSMNTKNAMETYNNMGLQLGTQIGNKYAADVQDNVGLMSYYAALNEADKNLEGTKYGADQNLLGNQYTADKGLEGQLGSANIYGQAQRDSATISGQAQRDAAGISAEATKYAANVNAEVQKAYYASQAAQGPEDVFGLLNKAKSEEEFVAVLVRQGISEGLAQDFWKNRKVKSANDELSNTIMQNFGIPKVPTGPVNGLWGVPNVNQPSPVQQAPAIGVPSTPQYNPNSGYVENSFGNWLYDHNFVKAQNK